MVTEMAKAHDVKVRGYVSCVMGCPYQGDIDAEEVRRVTQLLFNLGCYEVSLGDTIGIGTPDLTDNLLRTLLESRDGEPQIDINSLASHFHNTYERAIQNLVVSLAHGVRVIDSSVAGIGGCPYAKGASGNVATEDVLYLCELLNIEHGVDMQKMIETGDFISKELDRENLAKVTMADMEPATLEATRKSIHEES